MFQRFFRSVASIKIDKNDVRRFREFIDEEIDDIAIAGRNSATWNSRDVVVAQDLPITKGIQERMREFDKLEEAQEICELLRQVVRQPPADVTFADETEDLLPELFGGLSVRREDVDVHLNGNELVVIGEVKERKREVSSATGPGASVSSSCA